MTVVNKVIQISHYIFSMVICQHPGGEDIILEHAGRDATIPFMEVGHSKDALAILRKYQIGMLVEVESFHINILTKE